MLSDSTRLAHSNRFPHRKAATTYEYSGKPFIAQEESSDEVLSDSDQSHYTSSSVPVPAPHSSLSLSPAAMFLSAFSSPIQQTNLPDSEGSIIGGYTLGPIIGHGGSSTIRRASSTSGGIVAVKIVARSDLAKQGNPTLARKRLDYEASIWATLSHEHILPLFSTVHTSYADYFFTLFCPTGSLYDIIKRYGQQAFPLDDLAVVFGQVVRGLRYLHEVAGVVHRDIKLENVLVDEMGVCRIADFGMARKIGELDGDDEYNPEDGDRHHGRATPHTLIRNARHRNSAPLASKTPTQPAHVFQPGSLPYAAPELLRSSPLAPHPAQDIWALGVLLYVMLTGRLPFHDSFEPRVQMKILHGAFDIPHDIGRGAERILRGCLDSSVHTRWTIDMVDEVAWDIGSTTEDDDTATDTDNDYPLVKNPSKPSTRSPSRSRPVTLGTPRSSSRAKRSLSRDPVQTQSRSRSKGSVPMPSLAALDTSILGTASVFDSPVHHFPHESAVNTSPSAFLVRGRPEKPRVYPPSRSPSPSLLPRTPVDAVLMEPTSPRQCSAPGRRSGRGDGSPPPPSLPDPDDTFSTSRGERQRYTRGDRFRPPRWLSHSTTALDGHRRTCPCAEAIPLFVGFQAPVWQLRLGLLVHCSRFHLGRAM
jgi:MAP/microtubule affinity-regulating kinase